ncbi:hypothetical protein ABTZ93_45740 [Streptomyces sp. NPDC097941]|uniref:hypothetical protein n=1 Tax=Streptomyces sp. NPDC097941 TaxID=3155685 RepID=UPI003321E52B
MAYPAALALQLRVGAELSGRALVALEVTESRWQPGMSCLAAGKRRDVESSETEWPGEAAAAA